MQSTEQTMTTSTFAQHGYALRRYWMLRTQYERRRLPNARPEHEIVADLIQLCSSAFQYYEFTTPRDPYVSAMWLRRAVLHAHGLHESIYSREHPIRWRQAYETSHSTAAAG